MFFELLCVTSLLLNMSRPVPAPPSTAEEDEAPVFVYLSPEEFRVSFPEPERLNEPLAAFRSAERILMSEARDGATNQVVIFMPDGSTAYGRDYFFSGDPLRLRELRGGYEAIAIGPTVCMREFQENWSCEETEFSVGLRPIERKAIIQWDSGEFPCESGGCRFYRIVQADTVDINGLLINSEPGKNHYQFELFVKADGTPLMFTESRITDGRMAEPTASFLYDFQTPVPPFELPAMR